METTNIWNEKYSYVGKFFSLMIAIIISGTEIYHHKNTGDDKNPIKMELVVVKSLFRWFVETTDATLSRQSV